MDEQRIKMAAEYTPPALYLCVYDFFVHDLHSVYPNAVHPADPCHLVTCLELFRHALTLGRLLHQSGEHRFGLLVNV